MDTLPPEVDALTRRQIDHELDLVRGAIDLVADRESLRVTVAGLHFGEQLLAESRRLATANGVTIRPIWNAEDAGCDLTVETND